MEFFEKIESIPPYQRLLIFCILIAGLLVGYYRLFYKKNSLEVLRLKGEHSRLEFLLKSAELNVDRYPKLKAEVKELSHKLSMALTQLPSKKEIPELLTQISFFGRRAGLEFLLFSPLEERLQDFYAEVPVQIEVLGRYHDMARFFDRIGRYGRIINVSELNMGEPKFEENRPLIKARYVTTAFRFLDQKEIEELKKREKEKDKDKKRKR